MGSGSAVVEVPFGSDLVSEHVALEVFAGPSSDGFVHLLILASGAEPVEARILITAVLLVGHLQITVPGIPGLPGAPNVSINRIRASLGGALTYYEHIHGHPVAYRPGASACQTPAHAADGTSVQASHSRMVRALRRRRSSRARRRRR